MSPLHSPGSWSLPTSPKPLCGSRSQSLSLHSPGCRAHSLSLVLTHSLLVLTLIQMVVVLDRLLHITEILLAIKLVIKINVISTPPGTVNLSLYLSIRWCGFCHMTFWHRNRLVEGLLLTLHGCSVQILWGVYWVLIWNLRDREYAMNNIIIMRVPVLNAPETHS